MQLKEKVLGFALRAAGGRLRRRRLQGVCAVVLALRLEQAGPLSPVLREMREGGLTDLTEVPVGAEILEVRLTDMGEREMARRTFADGGGFAPAAGYPHHAQPARLLCMCSPSETGAND